MKTLQKHHYTWVFGTRAPSRGRFHDFGQWTGYPKHAKNKIKLAQDKPRCPKIAHDAPEKPKKTTNCVKKRTEIVPGQVGPRWIKIAQNRPRWL